MVNDPADPRSDENISSLEKCEAVSGLPFPLVGVGASAGGLEAFEELLTNLPAEPGLAILFVLHLEPHRKSQLVEVLSHWTSMTVQEAENGMLVKPNHLYLIPPNSLMAIADSRLSLAPRPAHGQQLPIDHLFRSLAQVLNERAIGVILSGGGNDGTHGFQAIKEQGGITFAQDDKTAVCPSMPRSAVLDGNVDYVLPPKEIAHELARLVQHPYTRETGKSEPTPEITDATHNIIQLLRTFGSVDFSQYKQTTVQRRIQRRMALRGLGSAGEYLGVLKKDERELKNLFQDLLIPFTQFFRDPEVFEVLKQSVFPALLANRKPDLPIRIWSAGCSSGEEAYSLAITLLEVLSERDQAFPIKILATDVNESLLERARAGVYLDNITVDVSPERLRHFFVRGEGNYQINKAVRELCIFSRHNLATDPPFSHMDLVSCRNVLIYMGGALQQRVLPILHYALNPNGYLLLGSSETVGHFSDLFTTVDHKHRVYMKNPMATASKVDFGPWRAGAGEPQHGLQPSTVPLWTTADVQKEADRIVLNRFAPVGVVVDEAMKVLQFRGQTSRYLEPPPGPACLELMRMLREGLLADVRKALAQAKAENITTSCENARVVEGAQSRLVRVEVIPFMVPPTGVRFFLVLFQDTSQQPAAPAVAAVPIVPPGADQQRVVQLQQELTALREYVQSVIEERESTNEELRSANEEILSANEELQSTNEELQTAKEEAQSANEELATVNEELHRRNAELASTNDDLVNILSGVNIPILMVTRDLRIHLFTPVAEKVFNLIPTDVNRPISDIRSKLQMADLSQLITDVIDTLKPHDAVVTDTEHHTYSLRIRPNVTQDKRIEGASVVLLDLDAIKDTLKATWAEEKHAS